MSNLNKSVWAAPAITVSRMKDSQAILQGIPTDGQFIIQNGQTVPLLHS